MKKNDYKGTDSDIANKILYSVRGSQSSADVGLSDKQFNQLKKLVKKYNIKVTTKAFN